MTVQGPHQLLHHHAGRPAMLPLAMSVTVMHAEEEKEAGPACGLSNKLPHAVILIAQQLLGAGAGRLGHPVVP